MQVAIPLYEGFTALDAIGPYEVLSRLPEADIKWVAEQAGPKQTETNMLRIAADSSYADVPSPEILVVPGGFGTRRLLEDEPLLEWIRSVHETSTWTTSVCTGSLLLGAAGVLNGLEATTHWASLEQLEQFGAKPVKRRVVEQGKVMTAAGVSAGIDMALRLVDKLFGPEAAQAIQLGIEYDPEPPYDSGSPDKAPAEIVKVVRAVSEQMERDFEAEPAP